MARNDKITMPTSGAGITRYFEDSKTKVELQPEHVIIFAIVIILLLAFLHLQGGWFG